MRASVATTAVAKRTTGIQFAALPYRVTPEGLEVLLITTRRTRRWIVPKGWPIEGLEPAASAAQEALEEAGISGEVRKEPVGFFSYVKELRNNIAVPCKVEVFALKVTRQRRTWAEKEAREQRWFAIADAAKMVEEPGLKRLILKFGAQYAPKAH
jgi:8-oxo-dGTP pyrophosphatase MutT (NUDIX family)